MVSFLSGRHTKYCVIALSLWLVIAAHADTFTLPAPSLTGLYSGTLGGGGKTQDADFGTAFLSIDQLSIHLVGTYTPGSGHDTGGQTETAYGQLEAYLPGWGILPRLMSPLDADFDLTLRFYPMVNPNEDWSVLLDGREDIGARLLMPAFDVIEQVPQINVSTAELILEATPVPDPATLFLLFTGLITARKLRRLP